MSVLQPALATPARTGIFQRRLKSLAHEMSRTLYRTTRSSLFSNGDFAVGFLDARGRMLEQDEHLPLMAFSLFPGAQYLIDFFGADVHDGDVFIHNDVWCNNLQHADTGFYKPIFVDGELLAWAACRGHWADIGGAVKGTSNPEAVEVWQEAFRIPPVKVWDCGQPRRDVWELIMANVRMREVVEADAKAQLGACVVGERRLKELAAREGPARFRQDVEALFESTEKMVRAEIRELPDGRYSAESYVNHDAPDGLTRCAIRVTVEVRDDEIWFDFSGSDPQTRSFINAPFTATASAAYISLLYMLSPQVPHNDGLLRPVHITAPEGSILNASFPAATFMGNKLTANIGEAVMLAMAQALPEKVTAPWGRRLTYRVGGTDPRNGQPFQEVFFLTYEGGGATAGLDGYNQPGLLGCGNVLSQDYEELEVRNPMYLLEHEYVQDSGGPGRWRGGLGTRTRVRYYGDRTTALSHGDGTLEPSEGINGGLPGTLNRIDIRYPDGHTHTPRAHEMIGDIPPETESIHYGAGGGGFESPLDRDPAAVAEDVRCGFVSRETAEAVYGVVLGPDGTVDLTATAECRERMSAVEPNGSI